MLATPAVLPFALLAVACVPELVPPNVLDNPDGDFDGDGFSENEGDCDDEDAARSPGAAEVCKDGVDNDCDGAPGECAINGDHSLAESPFWEGDAGGDLGGTGLAVADMTGDGAIDVVLTAPGHVDGEYLGKIYMVRGPLGTWDALSSVRADLSFAGPAVTAYGVAAGDLDGNGVGDLLAGDPSLEFEGEEPGGFFVAVQPFADRQRASKLLLEVGGEAGGRLGAAVAVLGDTSGDGFGDLAAGAPFGDLEGGGTGRTSVHLGSADALDPGSLDYAILGESPGDQSGTAITVVGDVDGDGRADFAIGAPGETSGGPGAGAVYVVFGGIGGHDLDLADAERKIVGSPHDGLGAVLASADVDGDGAADLLAGLPTRGSSPASPGGAALLLAPLQSGALASLEAWDLSGEAQGDAAGTAVCAPGDMDGDGQGDVAIGAPGSARAFAAGGGIFLFHGPGAGQGSLVEADAFLGGASRDDAAGGVLAGGDLDADGFADLFVGVPAAGGANGVTSGKLYFVHGGGI